MAAVRTARLLALGAPAAVAAAVLGGCGGVAPNAHGRVLAVAAESQYANVIAQVGGREVVVTAIMDNPSVDPHAFEASPSVANAISTAQLVVQNGLGYDSFMNKIEAAAPSGSRRVIDVQHLLGLPDTMPNPHLWYAPSTMPKVAARIAADLAVLKPRYARSFRANSARFDRALQPWYRLLHRIRARFAGTRVATTEPVADALLEAAGLVNATPFSFQADIMNGIDPAPQGISLENRLLSGHAVKAFLFNTQVTDSLSDGFRRLARGHGIPVVGVYETMPRGYDYPRWMLAETEALERALVDGTSTEHL